MSERVKSNENPFSVKIVGMLLAISLVAFAAVIVVSAWAPELRDRDSAGQHPFSTSALGYNGLYQLLEAQGEDVQISRTPRLLEDYHDGVMVVTLSDRWNMRGKLDNLDVDQPAVIILPKWTGRVSSFNNKRQADTRFEEARSINDLITKIDASAEIGRIAPDSFEDIATPFGKHSPLPDEKLQVIRSDYLETVVGNSDGALLAKDPYSDIYYLADPDMANTFGLSELGNARFTLAMLNWMKYYEDAPIYMDATIHGFERTENPLQMAFDIPFIGATLTFFAAMGLLGWAAAVRFGPQTREERVFALGKQALAENSAGLFTMARRETQLAPGYLNLIRKRVAKDVGAPKTLDEAHLSDLFDRLGESESTQKRWSDVAGGLKTPATSREDLMNKARDLYRWRRDITGRR